MREKPTSCSPTYRTNDELREKSRAENENGEREKNFRFYDRNENISRIRIANIYTVVEGAIWKEMTFRVNTHRL